MPLLNPGDECPACGQVIRELPPHCACIYEHPALLPPPEVVAYVKASQKLPPGSKVVLFLPNPPQWICVDPDALNWAKVNESGASCRCTLVTSKEAPEITRKHFDSWLIDHDEIFQTLADI